MPRRLELVSASATVMRPRPAHPLLVAALRLAALVIVAGAAACASRSRLHTRALGDADEADTHDGTDAALLDTDTDAASLDTTSIAETSSRSDVGGASCLDRPTTCPPGDDFGQTRSVREAFDLCSTVVGQKVCGSLTLVFDREGCLLEVTGIRDYPGAFVDCVVGTVSAKRWLCAGGSSLRMFEACGP